MQFRFAGAIFAGVILMTGCAARQPGVSPHPGLNMYSKQQDVELGKQAAAQVRQQADVVQNPRLQDYLSAVGRKLAATQAADDYPYTFTLLNDKSVNAFALPGGPTFVYSGLLDAAQNEAQLAGVLAHEISHVVLRHGTSEASKANLLQLPAAILGSIMGDSSQAAQLGQMGLGLGLNMLMLRYSRQAESEADALGTKIMYQAGYDPVEMARFFQILDSQGGSRAPQFLSDHPSPGNRVQAVEAELKTYPPKEFTASTGEFKQAQQLVAQLPPPKNPQGNTPAAGVQSVAPGSDARRYQGPRFGVAYPGNWQALGRPDSSMVVVAPPSGLARNPYGDLVVAAGALMSYYPARANNLADATRELIARMQDGNPTLQPAGSPQQVSVHGSQGLATPLSGASPYGGRETNYLLTVPRPEGLFYLIVVMPERAGADGQRVFQQMVQSLQFPA